MWQPRSIKLVNLMSHVLTEYNFQQNIVTLFQGNNLDDDGQESNGSGKSVLIEAIAYALLGSGLKKANDSDLIRNGEKQAYVRLELENSRNKQVLEIEREINLKTTSKLTIHLNGVDQKDKFATIPDGNKFILDLIGISRKDLLNYYIISKEKYISFYSSSDTDKKDVISRFSKADQIDGVEIDIQSKLNEFNTKIDELKRESLKVDTQIETYQEQIEEEKNTDREKLKNEQILQYGDQIVKSDYQIFDKNHYIKQSESKNVILNIQIKRYEKVIGEFNRQLELFKATDYTKELSVIDQKEQKVKQEENQRKLEKQNLEKEFDESNQFLREIEIGLKGLITCPKCSHEFIPNKEFDAVEAKETKPLIETGIKELQANVDKIKIELQNFRSKYLNIDSERDIYRKKVKEFQDQKHVIELKIQRCKNGIKNIEGSIKNNNNNINNLTNEIKNLTSNIVKIKGLIKQLQDQEIEDQIAKIQVKIKNLEIQKVKIEEDVKIQETERFKNEQWIYNFKKFKSFLANKSVKSIEGLSNLMLKKMNSNLQVQLEGYGILKNGDLREKITPYILRDGFNEGSFFKFSGGERGRIEIATISGIQQLINLNTNSGGLDILMVDEILESIDGKGIQSIAKSAKKLNKTIGLITHVNIPTEIDYSVVTIEKQNKISKIV